MISSDNAVSRFREEQTTVKSTYAALLFGLLLAGVGLGAFAQVLEADPEFVAEAPVGEPPVADDSLGKIDLKSYFEAPEYADMRNACRGNDTKTCYDATRKAYEQERNPLQANRLAMALALRAFDRGDSNSGSELMTTLDGNYPLLQDYIDFYLGETEYGRQRFESALPHFAKVPEDSRLYLQARFRIAFSKAKLAHPEALPLLEELLTLHPSFFRAIEARYELANLLRREQPERAAELYEQVMVDRPRAGIGLIAEQRLGELAKGRPDPERIARIRVLQAEAFNAKFQYKQAESLVAETLRTLAPELKPRPVFGSLNLALGQAQFRQRQYTKAIDSFQKALAGPISDSDRAELLYWQTDAHLRKGETESALRVGNQFLSSYSRHERACDVRHMMARAHRIRDRFDQALPYYRDIAQFHPTCSHTADALWNVGWLHYKQADYHTAKAALSRVATTSPSRFERERALYWLARIATIQGYDEYAEDLLRLLVSRYPLSYYPNLAAQRLMEGGKPLPANYTDKTDLTDMEPGDDLSLNLAPYREDKALIRGVEFLRLERSPEARREFGHFQELHDGEQRAYLLVAYMYHLADDWPRSIWLFRTQLNQYEWNYPQEGNRGAWLLAYPRPYRDMTLRYSAESGIDPLLLTALMREESSFQADVRSFAHAIGLTQIIASTGRHIARRLGVKNFQTGQLTIPDVSIRFGADHVKELLDNYRGNQALAIAAYNAGQGAVNRWLNAMPDVPMDEFVEDIPYRETRHYVRRVLKSYGIYRHLYTEEGLGFMLWSAPRQPPLRDSFAIERSPDETAAIGNEAPSGDPQEAVQERPDGE